MTRFQALEVADWRQFGSVQIDFHPRATIITGANGSGKTTLLSILSQHFGWATAFIGTLRIDRQGALRYFSGFIGDVAAENVGVGTLTYDDGGVASLQAHTEGASFRIAIHGSQTVPGVYITSHRPVYSYQTVAEILLAHGPACVAGRLSRLRVITQDGVVGAQLAGRIEGDQLHSTPRFLNR